jgi:hypothetical protein
MLTFWAQQHILGLQPINKTTIVFFYYNSNYKFMLMIA